MCDPCPAGEFGTDENECTGLRACKPCPSRTLQPLTGGTSCLECPADGVDCYEQAELRVLPGWFLADADRLDDMLRDAPATHRRHLTSSSAEAGGVGVTAANLSLVLCPRRVSCLGGNAANATASMCAPGHTGPLCGMCEPGRYRGSKGECVECSSDASRSLAFCVGGAVLVLLLACVYLRVTFGRAARAPQRPSDEEKSRPRLGRTPSSEEERPTAARVMVAKLGPKMRRSASLGKILLAYFQVLNAFSQLPSVRWPDGFSEYLDVLAPFSFQIFSAAPIGCRAGLDIGFYHELLSLLLLPPLLATIVVVLAVLVACARLPRDQPRGVFAVACRPEVCTLQLWLLMMLYPSLAKTALQPYDCMRVGDRRLMVVDPSVDCDDDDWADLAIMGAIGTVVYTLGFPLLCFVVCRRAHMHRAAAAAAPARIGDASETAAEEPGGGESAAALGEETWPHASSRAGESMGRAMLLLRSYDEEFWYWESLEMVRKWLLTCVVLVVVPYDSLLQVYFGLLVCVVSVLLVAVHQPYSDPLCGRVQLLALAQLTFTYMSGMIFFDSGGDTDRTFGEGGGSDDGKVVWATVLVGINSLTFVVLGVGLWRAVGGATREAQAERQQWDEESAQLQLRIREMEASLAEPALPAALRRKRIALDALQLEASLGAGASGEVFAARYLGTPVAVKRLHARAHGCERTGAAFREEVRLLLELAHPNVVQLLGGSWDVGSAEMCLVLELCPKGSLDDLLRSERHAHSDAKPLTWVADMLPIATGVARGMAYLHAQSPPIIHRDLKPANVLLGEGQTPKVGDMGTALEMGSGMQDLVAGAGTPLFQAPEVLRRELADESCDVWSYGCVLCCLSTRADNPYHPTPPTTAVDFVSKLKLRPTAPRDSPLDGVVDAATELEYEDRQTFEELLEALESDEMRARARGADRAQAEARQRREERQRETEVALWHKRGIVVTSGAAETAAAVAPARSPAAGALPTAPHYLPSPARTFQAASRAAIVAQRPRVISRPEKMRHSARAPDCEAELDEATKAAAIKERRAARKRSLVAADSMRSLHGHKEGPGRLTVRGGGAGSSNESSEVAPRPPETQPRLEEETVQKV